MSIIPLYSFFLFFSFSYSERMPHLLSLIYSSDTALCLVSARARGVMGPMKAAVAAILTKAAAVNIPRADEASSPATLTFAVPSAPPRPRHEGCRQSCFPRQLYHGLLEAIKHVGGAEEGIEEAVATAIVAWNPSDHAGSGRLSPPTSGVNSP